KIVLPEGTDDRVVIAASQAQEAKYAKITVIGKEKAVKEKAKQLGVSLAGVNILDYEAAPDFDEYVNTFYELRKHKGMTPEEARSILVEKTVFYGALMARKGVVDSFVGGAVATSADVARAAIYCVGIDRKAGTLSSSFVI
ncbi:MAG: phosphate acyltransferase, partial [Candidatus Omnitrophica bacterium]|nr:phosphate acyltransferase [Candidatus Omnitrophota bacterium]